MKEEKYPITQAIRFLRERHLQFTSHLYDYVEHGGTEVAASELGLDENSVIKTIVLEDELQHPLIVLMHGNKEISTKNLARIISVKRLIPCSPNTVTKHTGYIVGGTSPFGTKIKLPIYLEKSIYELDKIYINGGKRGFLVGVSPKEIIKVMEVKLVEVAV